MKQTNNKTRNMALALVTLCTMGLSSPTFAGTRPGDPVELIFVGNKNNQPLFQLKLNNSEKGIYFISVKDPDQNVLFSEKIKGVDIVRNYLVNINEEEYYSPSFGLKFEVTNLATHQTQEYKVRSETEKYVSNNVIVSKL